MEGKIAINDPRVDGAGNGRIALWTGQLGQEFVRALLKQDLALSRDDRQLADWTARGRYLSPSASTPTSPNYKLGVGQKVEPLGGKLAEAGASAPVGARCVCRKAPHLNAATVFVNWLLAKEAQASWGNMVSRPSRRIDVHCRHVAGKGVDYFDIDAKSGFICATRRRRFQGVAAIIRDQTIIGP
jgi:hypothetical protein